MTKSSPLIWQLLHTVKSMVKISSIFVAFLENTKFIKSSSRDNFTISEFRNFSVDFFNHKHISYIWLDLEAKKWNWWLRNLIINKILSWTDQLKRGFSFCFFAKFAMCRTWPRWRFIADKTLDKTRLVYFGH